MFGEIHRFNISSPAEAVRALCANFPKFRSYLLGSHLKQIGFQVLVDDVAIDQPELAHPFSRTIEFVPIIIGADSAGTKTLIGAVLIAAAVVIGVGSGGAAGTVAGVLLNVGVGFIAGGILQAMTPVPHSADAPQEDSRNTPSYVFSGPVNTTAQRQPIPVGYGRMIVGSAVISAGISTEDITASTLITPELFTAADDTQSDYSPGSDRT
jgi:predicted phage tail protein